MLIVGALVCAALFVGWRIDRANPGLASRLNKKQPETVYDTVHPIRILPGMVGAHDCASSDSGGCS